MAKNAITALKWANPKSIANSFEQTFYDANASLFNVKTSIYNENRSIFDVIKSDVILKGLFNRSKLNDDFKQFPKEQLAREVIQTALLEQTPFVTFKEHRIYIPTYSIEINDIYYKHADLLKEEPYSQCMKDENYAIVNPFKTYGLALLDSPFTRLIRLEAKKDNIHVFYHCAFETLFFVDEECNLIEELPILDEKCQYKDNLHLFENLNTIANDYLYHDRTKLFSDLLKLNLLSEAYYDECMEEELKYQKKMKRKNHDL